MQPNQDINTHAKYITVVDGECLLWNSIKAAHISLRPEDSGVHVFRLVYRHYASSGWVQDLNHIIHACYTYGYTPIYDTPTGDLLIGKQLTQEQIDEANKQPSYPKQ